MTYNKAELEELSLKYFGPRHAELSIEQKLDQLIPLDSGLSQKARENYQAMSAEQINESLYHLLLAAEVVPKVIAALQSARAKAEKGEP